MKTFVAAVLSFGLGFSTFTATVNESQKSAVFSARNIRSFILDGNPMITDSATIGTLERQE